MKTVGKLAIVFAIIFLVTAITGAALAAAGAAKYAVDNDVPGQLEEFMQDHGGNFEGLLDSFGQPSAERFSFSQTMSVNESIERISVENAVGDIVVVAGDSNELTIKCDGIFSQACIFNSFDTEINAVFEKTANWNLGNININTGTITVELPEDYSGALEITESVGNIEIGFDGLSELSMSKVTGNIEAEHCKAGILLIESCTGNIEFSGSLLGFALISNLGEIDIELDSAPEMDCDISKNLGEIEIDLPVGTNVSVTESNNMGGVTTPGSNNANAPDACSFNINDNLGTISIETTGD